MPTDDILNATFSRLRREFSTKTKRDFLKDIQGQITENEDIQEVLHNPGIPGRHKYLAVTFDRRRNDTQFSYTYFDLLLVALDAISGGSGIYKPSNQMRALRWNSTRLNLLRVLRFFARNNTQVKFRRVLALPFPIPPVGQRVDTTVHLK
jgi:hypothetical protein